LSYIPKTYQCFLIEIVFILIPAADSSTATLLQLAHNY